jgi:hypothetical protein
VGVFGSVPVPVSDAAVDARLALDFGASRSVTSCSISSIRLLADPVGDDDCSR